MQDFILSTRQCAPTKGVLYICKIFFPLLVRFRRLSFIISLPLLSTGLVVFVALSLELQSLLLGLAAVCSPAHLLLLLVPAQTRSELDVDPRRSREAKALGHFDQVELVHVKDGTERVGGVGLQVRTVAFLGGLYIIQSA